MYVVFVNKAWSSYKTRSIAFIFSIQFFAIQFLTKRERVCIIFVLAGKLFKKRGKKKNKSFFLSFLANGAFVGCCCSFSDLRFFFHSFHSISLQYFWIPGTLENNRSILFLNVNFILTCLNHNLRENNLFFNSCFSMLVSVKFLISFVV